MRGVLPDKLLDNGSAEEASLLWDEYKYRHDLIWKHMIRSTLSLVALIALPYTEKFADNNSLIILTSVVAVFYQIYSYWVTRIEIKLLYKVKYLHRSRQLVLFRMHMEEKDKYKDLNDAQTLERVNKKINGGFKLRVDVYCILIFLISLAAIAINIFHIYGVTIL